jgi:hypothetical protein
MKSIIAGNGSYLFLTLASSKEPVRVMASKQLWKCPECGREFSRKGQWHSHSSLPVDALFSGKPKQLREIFDKIVHELQKDGSVIRVDASKSSINLAGRSHFGGVHVLKDSLDIGFILDRKINNRRIRKIQQITNNIFAHNVTVEKPSDVDHELISWLKEAYSLRKS